MKTETKPGILNRVHLGMRLWLWSVAQSRPVTADLIAREWGVTRATAYRYLRALRDAQQVAGKESA